MCFNLTELASFGRVDWYVPATARWNERDPTREGSETTEWALSDMVIHNDIKGKERKDRA